MNLYVDAEFPISADTDSLHRDQLLSYSRPGTWGSAAQRTAIAATARMARCEAGVQESIGDEGFAELGDLPEAARRVARAVALGGIEIDRKFCEQAQTDGVTEGAYVEIVGLVARLAHLDVFAPPSSHRTGRRNGQFVVPLVGARTRRKNRSPQRGSVPAAGRPRGLRSRSLANGPRH